MNRKKVINPRRRRRVPAQFSWVDHRLVRDGHVQGRSTEALALYLFLLTVGDGEGLSFYGVRSMEKHLGLNESRLAGARNELVRAGLIEWRSGLYQVLDLDPVYVEPEPGSFPRSSPNPTGQTRPFGEVLKGLMGDEA